MITILESNGYETAVADNGLVAVEVAKSSHPDLVLMDIQMPKLDGFGALQRLREDELTKSMPVVAISGNAMPRDIEKMRLAGFDDYISKPIKIVDVLDVISRNLVPQD